MTLHFQRSQLKAGQLERRTFEGKEYAIAPATILVAGVLNGGLVTPDELSAFAERWNGRPIPLRHPQDGAGEYISANSPDVVSSTVIGTFYNAKFVNDRIRGEMWFDVAKINSLGGDALAAFRRLEDGEVLEVSTGYFAEYLEDRSGQFKGRAFDEVHHALVPDHIALLPDEIGACSVLDGCGANRVNAQQKDFSTSVMVAFYLSSENAAALSSLWPDKNTAIDATDLHVTLTYLGDKENLQTNFEQLSLMLADFSEMQTVILGEVGGWSRFSGEEEDAVTLLVESEGLSSFRQWVSATIQWNLDQPVSRPVQYVPHITLAYVPKSESIELPAVDRIPLAFNQLGLSWGDQTVIFPLKGELRDVTATLEVAKEHFMANQQQKTPCDKEKEKEIVVTNADEGGKQEVKESPPEKAATTVAESKVDPAVAEFAQLVAELGGAQALRSILTDIVANQKAEREQLASQIKANTALKMNDADLKVMSIEGLRTLASLGRQNARDYGGRGGAVVNARFQEEDSEFESFAMPEKK